MKPIVRTASFFSIWMAEFLRHPLLLFGLVVGPFVVLIAFGNGVDYSEIRPDVILVRNEASDARAPELPERLHEHVNVVAETTDLAAAVESLREGEVDGIAVIPAEFDEALRAGEHIPIQIFTSEIDPVTVQFTESYLRDRVGRLNQQTLADAIASAQTSIGEVETHIATAREVLDVARAAGGDIETVRLQVDELQALLGPITAATNVIATASNTISLFLPDAERPANAVAEFRDSVVELEALVDELDERIAEAGEQGFPPPEEDLDEIDRQLGDVAETAQSFSQIPPEVLSAPFELELENISPFQPTFTGFFAPAVLVLLVQHLGISLAALSMTRLRLFGMLDMLRVAPVRTLEIVNGKYLSYGVLIVVVTFAGIGTMAVVLDVPMFGPWWQLAALLGALALASLGLGFLVAMLASSEQQAAQVAMLVLLAGVFFSGLVVSLERIAWPMRSVSMVLPSTYAIRSAQDIMLRGVLRHPEDLASLAAVGVVLYLMTALTLSRLLHPR